MTPTDPTHSSPANGGAPVRLEGIGPAAPPPSAARIFDALDTSLVGAAVLDREGRIIKANGRLCGTLRTAAEDLLGRSWEELTPLEERFLENVRLAQILRGEGPRQAFDKRLRRPDGSVVRVRMEARPTLGPDGRPAGTLLLVLDLTEQGEIQARLVSSEDSAALMLAAVEQSPACIVITDTTGAIEYTNPKFTELTGYTREEVLGKNPRILKSGLQPMGLYEDLWRTITAGGTWRGRFSNRKKDGSIFWEDSVIGPIYRGGRIAHYLAVKEDVTARREMERHLRQVEKMEALGTLAGGIAHDFNNVLTAIMSSAELMDWKLPEDSPLRPKLQVILQAGQRAKELNRRILNFSRPADERKVPFDLTAVVRECAQLLQNTLPRSVSVQASVDSSIWTVGDPGQIHQVVMNLALNGFQALPGGQGRLAISLTEAPATLAQEQGEGAGPMRAVLRIVDDGAGMDEAVLSRVFEPFFTTKEAGGGSGLGLSVVHGIVRQHGGHIHISSEPGQGTTVTVELPTAAVQKGAEPAAGRDSLRGKEHLLVVDLEDVRVALAKEGLQTLGYRVTAKGDPRDALEAFREHPGIFDAVLLCYSSGPLSAEELAGRIRKLRARVPVVLASGSAAALEQGARNEALFDQVVPKPFSIEQIGRALRMALDARNPMPQAATSTAPAAAAVHGAILVAEDSAVTLSLLSSWLTKAGYTVFPARDGREAWEILNEQGSSSFAMVLTDVVMPRLDGIQLVERIREVDAEIPLVLLSSTVEKESLKAALHLQVNEFLAKPFDAEALLSCVAKLLSGVGAKQRSTETVQAVRRAQKAMVAEPERDLPIYSVHQSLNDAGGDVFRCFKQADGSVLFILADVVGHSVISSYAVAAFLGLLSSLVADYHSLLQLARRLSRCIQEGPFSEVPVCALIGHWTPATGRLHVLNAGLPHGLLTGPDRCQRVALNGTPLGIFDEPLVEEKVLMLREGDRLLFASDGVFEARDEAGRIFEDSAAQAWCEARTSLPVPQAVASMADAARALMGGVIQDDLLAVGFEQPPLRFEGLRTELPSEPEAIDAAVRELEACIDGAPRSIPLTRSRRFDILTAAREALTNAMAHGNGGDPSKRIVLSARWEVAPPSFHLAVVDEGLGFDLENLAPQEDPLSERGRGIPFIRHSANRVAMVGGELQAVFEWEA